MPALVQPRQVHMGLVTPSEDGVEINDDIDDDGGEWRRRVLEMTSAEAVAMAVFFVSKTNEFI